MLAAWRLHLIADHKEARMRSIIRRGILAMTALAVVSGAGLFTAAAPALAWSANGNTTNFEPALTNCVSPVDGNDYEWIAFTGTDGQINLLTYDTAEGYSATPDYSIQQQYRTGYYAVGAPAIACVGRTTNPLHVAWRNSSNHIVVAQVVNGGNGKVVLANVNTWPETTDASPGLGSSGSVYIGQLVVGWAGTDGSHHVNLQLANVSTDAQQGTKYTTSDITRAGQGVGVGQFNNGPENSGYYIAFLAASGTPNIFVGYFPGTGTFNLNAVRTTDSSDATPSISGTCLLWKGTGENWIHEGIFDGSDNLHSSRPTTDQTLGTPPVDNFGGTTAYTGTNHLIYYDTHAFYPSGNGICG
jgi:hypothetical protein